MTLKLYIEKLQDIQREHGDIEVLTYGCFKANLPQVLHRDTQFHEQFWSIAIPDSRKGEKVVRV